jgi:uncharacterized protein (TIGR02265 family)
VQSESSHGSSNPGLEQLLALTTPMDTCRGMFFNGLLETARALGGEDIHAQCFEALGRRKFVDFFSYPVADFLRAIFVLCELIGPRMGGEDAVMRQLGRRGTNDFLQSTVGKTMLALAGTDPHRLVATVPSACRASLSYGERSVRQLGEHRAALYARRDLLPLAYTEGVLTAALERSTARDIQVQGRRLGPLDADYEMHWS